MKFETFETFHVLIGPAVLHVSFFMITTHRDN